MGRCWKVLTRVRRRHERRSSTQTGKRFALWRLPGRRRVVGERLPARRLVRCGEPSGGWGPIAPVIASAAVFGSAQFALVVTALAGSGAARTAVASAVTINLRFVPMSVAVTPALRGGRVRRALEGQAVVDGSWVSAHQGGGRFNRRVLLAASAVQWPVWIVGSIVGVGVARTPPAASPSPSTLGSPASTGTWATAPSSAAPAADRAARSRSR